MKKNSKSSKDESKKLSKEKTPSIKKTDALRIANELQMDQVKLDVQNKELVQSHVEAEEIFRQYRDLYELAPVGYFTLTRDGTIRNANLAGANLLGVDRTNLINQHLERFVSDESRPAFGDFLNKLLSSEGREVEEFAFLKNGNELLWVHLEATCFECKEESRVVLVDISKQMRAEKTLQESEKRYRAVVSKVPVVIFVTDEKGVFTLSEGLGLAKLGLQPGQVVGLSAFDLYRDYPSIVGALKSALAGHSQRIEVEVQGLVFDAHFSCVFDHNDKVVKVVGVSSDITERVKAQEALKQSEAQYHLLADRMTDTIWLMDLNLNFIYVSPSVEKIRGYSLAELQQIPFEKLMTPASSQLAAELFTVEIPKVMSDPTYSAVYTKEFEFYGRDGSLHSVESKMSIVRDEKGNPISILGQDRDITERKQMEKLLRESEARNRAMVEAMPDMMFVQNRAGIYLDYHAANFPLIIASPETILGRSISDVLPPMHLDIYQSKFDLAFQTCEIQTHEFILDFPSGSLHLEARMIAYGEDTLLSIVRDITERKQTEKKIKDMEVFQRVLVNATKLASILLLDRMGTILIINEFGAELIGRHPDELLGLSIFDVYPQETSDAKEVVGTRKKRFNETCRTATEINFKDFWQGFWFENSMYPILDAAGDVVQVAVYSRNITELIKNEQLLRKSEQRYRTLAEASHDMIFVIDRDNKFDYVNSYISNQFEVQPGDLIGQPCSGWFGKSDADTTLKKLDQVFSTGKPSYSESEITFPHGVLSVSTWLIPLENQNGMVDNVLGVSRDIGDLKKLERSLRETNLQLESKVAKRTAELLDSRDQLRKLTQQLVVVQEEERRRISRELHDEAGQSLIGLRFTLDTIYRELPANLGDLRQRLGKSLALTDLAVKRIRSLARGLRPPILDLIGINLGIKELCQEFSDQTGIKVEYSGVDLEGLQDEASISLYRFVQEALTNAAKHAQAGKVQVTLEYKDEIIKVSVQDNGRGISNWDENPGLGMVGIKERFDILGGWLEVKPVMPKGTQVKVCLPWKDNNHLIR